MSTVQIAPELLVAVIGLGVTVLTVYGGLIKYLYDGHTTLDQLLRGANGSEGFVNETREAHEDLAESQKEINRTLRAHAALLQEMVYTMHQIAETLDDEEDIDDLDTRRLRHLEETLRQHHDDQTNYSPQWQSSDDVMNQDFTPDDDSDDRS
jgi:DNA repair ATPase RecN